MKRALQIAILSVASVPVIAALAIGFFWLRASLPHPRTTEESQTVRPVNYAPPLAVIPWSRDPDVLGAVSISPAWLPWEKTPRGARQINGASPPPASLERGHVDAGDVSEITRELATGYAADVDKALSHIAAMAEKDPIVVGQQLRGMGLPWVRALIATKHTPELDALLAKLEIPLAYDTGALEGILGVRARIALAQNKPDLALDFCRQWFAISSLYGTAPAIAAAEQALVMQHVPRSAIREFRASLEDHGPATATAPTTAPATQPPTLLHLSSESPEAAAFLVAARALNGEDLGALLARANLYLLAGRWEDAQRIFERTRMFPAAPPAAALENRARCIKARTGEIVSANRFLTERGP